MADRLLGRVSVHPFRARVPARDRAVEVLAEDRVFRPFDDRREVSSGLPRRDPVRDVHEGRDDRLLVPEVEVFDGHQGMEHVAPFRSDDHLRIPDRPAFPEALREHPTLLRVDPQAEVQGRLPDHLGPFVAEHLEELAVHLDETAVPQEADPHGHGARLERFLESLRGRLTGGLRVVPLEDLSDPGPDVLQQIEEEFVRFLRRPTVHDRHGLRTEARPDREGDRALQAEPDRGLRPIPVHFEEVLHGKGLVPLPHATDEARARADRATAVHEAPAGDVLHPGRMPREKPKDGGHRVVHPDLPEDPALDLADRLDQGVRRLREQLRLDQDPHHREMGRVMPFRALPLRHIMDQDEPRPPSEGPDLGREDFDVEGRPVLLAVPPKSDQAVRRLQVLQGLPKVRDVLGRTDVLDRHVEEFRPRESVDLEGGFDHVQEAKGLRVEDPHGQRAFLEEDAVGLRLPGRLVFRWPRFALHPASRTARTLAAPSEEPSPTPPPRGTAHLRGEYK